MNKLLSMREAAEQLGYSVPGLRKIVNRSRRRIRDAAAMGPTIRFIQPGKNGRIRFEQSALDEFKAKHTIDPDRMVSPEPARKRRPNRCAANVTKSHGIEPLWL